MIDIGLSLSIPFVAIIAYARTAWIQNDLLRWGFAHVLSLGWLQLGVSILLFLNIASASTVGIWIALSLFFAYPKVSFPKDKAFALYLLLIPYFSLSLVPPWYRDSLTYHLALPKLFTQNGGYTAGDEIIFGYFPLSWQTILSIPHFLGTDHLPLFNPRLIAVWLCGALACSTVGLARELGATPKWSLLSGILLLLVPTQIEFGTSCYVQVWLSLLCTLALAAVCIRKPVLVGICAGLAASAKYSGLFLCFIATLIMIRHKERWKFCVPMLLLGAPFYLRNWLEKGNPVFPLGYAHFGGEGWDLERAQGYAITLSNYGMGRDWSDFLLLIPRTFLTQDMVSFFQGSLGPIVGILFLGAIVQGRRHKIALMFVLIWCLLWALQVQQIRFLMPCIPIVIALGCSYWKKESTSGILFALITAFAWLFVPSQAVENAINPKAKTLYDAPLPFLWKRQHSTAFLLGHMSKEELLSRLLPDSYPIYQILNEQEIQGVWLVWGRGYVYYLNHPVRVDSVFGAWRFEELLNRTDAKQFAEELNNQKISHVLINMRFFLVDQNADHLGDGKTEELQRKFDALLQSGVLKEVQRDRSIFLYQLSGSGFDIKPQ